MPNKFGSPTVDVTEGDDCQPISITEKGTITPQKKKLDKIITKAVKVHHSEGHIQLTVNDRLRSVIKSKLWHMGNALHRLNTRQVANQ